MSTTPDPKTVREIARDCVADYIDDARDIAAHVMSHFGVGVPGDVYAWTDAVRTDLRASVVSWPAEQPAAEQDGDGVDAQIARFLTHFREDPDDMVIEGVRSHYLTVGMLRAVLADHDRLAARVAELEAENARMREYVAALNEAQVGLQTSAFYLGWLKGFKAMPTAGVYTQAHLDTVEYGDEVRALNADAAPQQPARDTADGGAE